MEKVISKNKLTTGDKVGLIVVIGFVVGFISLIVYNIIVLGVNSSI